MFKHYFVLGLVLFFSNFNYGQTKEDANFDSLVWSDEFDGNGAINTANWFHQTQLPIGGSWYNGEIQHYTNRVDNSYVSNGSLHILAKKETYTNQGVTKQYTSARLNSKFAFTYGRVEVRAKLPTGIGTWPAIWMLGKNINEDGAYWDNQGYGTTSWPACGEIDIMEHWGTNQNYVQSALHTPSSSGATVNHGGQIVPTASSEFHIYALEWTSEKMLFSVDDVVHYTYEPTIQNADTWPFDADQYLLLNIAIQQSIDPNFLESAMEIDYVRVYQESVTSVTEVEKDIVYFYPNPVKDKLIIQIPSKNIGDKVSISSVIGEKMKSFKATGSLMIVDLSDFESGIYFVRYKTVNGNICHKIIKE